MTAKIGLIGHPITHSISPQIHQSAFDALRIDANYEIWDIEPDELIDVINSLRDDDSLGCNITIPYKEAAMRYVDRLQETARYVGAINTIANEAGTLVGYNTDVFGFQTALTKIGVNPKGLSVVILGAGGAARAVAWALIWREVGTLTIINRTAIRAGRLRQDLAASAAGIPLQSYGIDNHDVPNVLKSADLIVQCTSIGLQGKSTEKERPFNFGFLTPRNRVFDLVANPPETPLVKFAKEQGCQASGGLPMLVYQASASFEIWTKQQAPIDIMMSTAKAWENENFNSHE